MKKLLLLLVLCLGGLSFGFAQNAVRIINGDSERVFLLTQVDSLTIRPAGYYGRLVPEPNEVISKTGLTLRASHHQVEVSSTNPTTIRFFVIDWYGFDVTPYSSIYLIDGIFSKKLTDNTFACDKVGTYQFWASYQDLSTKSDALLTVEAVSEISKPEKLPQVIVTADGETLVLDDENSLRRISFQNAESQNECGIQFLLQDGTEYQLDFSQISKILFAKDEATAIDEIRAGKEIIVYDEESCRVYVANAKKTSIMRIFNVEGKCLRVVNSNEMQLQGLPNGLYIVNYNGTLNAKILKK